MISLEDKQAILDLCALYSFYTDTGDAEMVANLFLSDGVFDGPPGRFEGREAIAKFNVDIHQRIKGSMHFTDNHIFEDAGDGVKHRCHLSLQIPTDEGVTIMLMTYEDEIVRADDGRWRFRIRLCRAFAP